MLRVGLRSAVSLSRCGAASRLEPRLPALTCFDGARTAFSNASVATPSLVPWRTHSLRTFSSTGTSPQEAKTAEETATAPLASYVGPMASTFFRLKMFSMGSLVLASAFTPVFLLAPAELGMSGRVGLALTALATSGVSTGIVGWIGSPYVGRMTLEAQPDAPLGPPAIVANTLTWRLKPLQTTIYEPSLIRPTSRPFANWELPQNPGAGTVLSSIQDSSDEVQKVLVAETRNLKTGSLVGQWWAETVPGAKSAPANGGKFAQDVRCVGVGKPVRHFQVHEELLGEDWRILG